MQEVFGITLEVTIRCPLHEPTRKPRLNCFSARSRDCLLTSHPREINASLVSPRSRSPSYRVDISFRDSGGMDFVKLKRLLSETTRDCGGTLGETYSATENCKLALLISYRLGFPTWREGSRMPCFVEHDVADWMDTQCANTDREGTNVTQTARTQVSSFSMIVTSSCI